MGFVGVIKWEGGMMEWVGDGGENMGGELVVHGMIR
jgi:hypothetical protein